MTWSYLLPAAVTKLWPQHACWLTHGQSSRWSNVLAAAWVQQLTELRLELSADCCRLQLTHQALADDACWLLQGLSA